MGEKTFVEERTMVNIELDVEEETGVLLAQIADKLNMTISQVVEYMLGNYLIQKALEEIKHPLVTYTYSEDSNEDTGNS